MAKKKKKGIENRLSVEVDKDDFSWWKTLNLVASLLL